MTLASLTIKEAAEQLAAGKINSEDLTADCLARIKKINPKINAFLEVCSESAIKQARESDLRRSKGKTLGAMDGIPIAIKDVIITKGIKTTAASKILGNFSPPFDATVIRRLKNAGAVILGKTNLDEFAMGSSTENSAYGPTKNPWDLTRVPGGSSGGSAAAVSADMCLGALGSDTGGSIRQPASLCSVAGFKSTYGMVSRYGLIAMTSSFDQIGPMAKTVEDALILQNVIEGYDPKDSTSYKNQKKTQIGKKDIKGLKIGVPREYFVEGLDKKVEEIIRKAIDKLSDLGAEAVEVSLPYSKYALSVYYLIMPSEVSSNLARFDGIKYGHSSSNAKNILQVYTKSRAEGFGAEAKRRIMLGTYALSAGYYDAYYLKAQKVRTLIKKDFDKAFEKVDLLVSATSPTVAFKVGEKTSDPLKMYLSDILTVPVNPAGLPAISIAAGFADNLPVGLQIIGPQFSDSLIFDAAAAFEESTDFHKKKPNLDGV